jgi:hypothetical protein
MVKKIHPHWTKWLNKTKLKALKTPHCPQNQGL